MHKTINILLRKLYEPVLLSSNVIKWGSPVPVFGDPLKSSLATLGLNPSNREFVDPTGEELKGNHRRFHTLNSLGIKNWKDIRSEHINLIRCSCKDYFDNNPYDRWFKELDEIISGTDVSYYHCEKKACHLDLVPFATTCKWTELTTKQKHSLIEQSTEGLANILRESSIEYLVLNGSTVVKTLENMACKNFYKERMIEWSLQRRNGRDVEGYAYSGYIESISGIELGKKVKVYGFNHNIQSSFGVTLQVKDSIRKWITSQVRKAV